MGNNSRSFKPGMPGGKNFNCHTGQQKSVERKRWRQIESRLLLEDDAACAKIPVHKLVHQRFLEALDIIKKATVVIAPPPREHRYQPYW